MSAWNSNLLLQGSPSYSSAILVIRNPLDALIAEWNRQQSEKLQDSSQNGSSHVKSVGRNYFGMKTLFCREKIYRIAGKFGGQ